MGRFVPLTLYLPVSSSLCRTGVGATEAAAIPLEGVRRKFKLLEKKPTKTLKRDFNEAWTSHDSTGSDSG